MPISKKSESGFSLILILLVLALEAVGGGFLCSKKSGNHFQFYKDTFEEMIKTFTFLPV